MSKSLLNEYNAQQECDKANEELVEMKQHLVVAEDEINELTSEPRENRNDALLKK
jgi:hypothetical protein